MPLLDNSLGHEVGRSASRPLLPSDPRLVLLFVSLVDAAVPDVPVSDVLGVLDHHLTDCIPVVVAVLN